MRRCWAKAGQATAGHEITAGTFHSFGGMVIRENLVTLGFDRPPAVLSAAAGWQLLAGLFDELNFETVEISTGQPGAVFAHLLHFFGQCRDHLVSPDRLERYLADLDSSGLPEPAVEYVQQRRAELLDMAAAYRRYEAAKREGSLIDFGDHLYLPVQLFRDDAKLRDAYRRRFRYIFVDEYQDTNHAQRELLLALLNPAEPDIVVIGDDDQAIYRWRGAVVQNILYFEQEAVFSPGQVKIVRMILNRRSCPPILDLANLAIVGVQQRHPKELDYHPDNKEGKAAIGHYLAGSDAAEGQWIAKKVKALETAPRDYPGNKRGYGAYAVLCRQRRLFEPIGQALDRAGVPYELVGGTGFYDRWEIRDMLSYLRVLVDPGDDLAVARILRSPRWKIGGRDIFHLAEWVEQANGKRGRGQEGLKPAARAHLMDAVLAHAEVPSLSAMAEARLASLVAELEGYQELRRAKPLSELVARVIGNTGYRVELACQTGFDARVALLNLAKLEAMAREFEAADAKARLADFVEYVRYAVDSQDEESEVRPVDEETNTVKVMSIHQAKGLEFPVVFVPGLAERIFPVNGRDEADKWHELPAALRCDYPHLPKLDLASAARPTDLTRAIEERKAAEKALRLDEERRLFYVAITRAQRQLYFTSAYWYSTNANPKERSIFWDLVAGSGMSEQLGEEECPKSNPNLMANGASGTVAGGQPALANLAACLLEGTSPSGCIEELTATDAERWPALRAEANVHLEGTAAPAVPAPELPPVEIGCSSLILYLDCPRHYRYVRVDHLPVRPSPAGRVGRDVHRRIEELSIGASVQPSDDAADEDGEASNAPREAQDWAEELSTEQILTEQVWPERLPPGQRPEGSVGGPAKIEELLARFGESAYGRRRPTYVEVPFRLPLQAGTLSGRLDRLDALPDGRWEVVDFKSGAAPAEPSVGHRRQLALYALAVRELWRVPAERISAHLFFLRDGTDFALQFSEQELDVLYKEAERTVGGIARGEFPIVTQRRCERCDYQHLCQG